MNHKAHFRKLIAQNFLQNQSLVIFPLIHLLTFLARKVKLKPLTISHFFERLEKNKLEL